MAIPPYPFLSSTGYERVKSRINESRQGFVSTYGKAFARNDILLALVEQLEKDIVELKRNQAFLLRVQNPTPGTSAVWNIPIAPLKFFPPSRYIPVQAG